MCKCQYHLNSKHNQSIFSLTGVLLNDKHKPGSTKIFIGKLKLPIKKKKSHWLQQCQYFNTVQIRSAKTGEFSAAENCKRHLLN